MESIKLESRKWGFIQVPPRDLILPQTVSREDEKMKRFFECGVFSSELVSVSVLVLTALVREGGRLGHRFKEGDLCKMSKICLISNLKPWFLAIIN